MEGHWALWEGSTKGNKKEEIRERKREREIKTTTTGIEERSHAVEQGKKRKEEKRKTSERKRG